MGTQKITSAGTFSGKYNKKTSFEDKNFSPMVSASELSPECKIDWLSVRRWLTFIQPIARFGSIDNVQWAGKIGVIIDSETQGILLK